MRDVLSFLTRATDSGRPVGWARVLSTWGSAPRRPGAALVAASPTEFAGSVSGGCVEHAVIDEVLGSLAAGRPQVVEYGIRDEQAWSAGLSCGGTVRILVEPFPAGTGPDGHVGVGCTLIEAMRNDRPVVLATRTDAAAPPALLDAEGLLLDGEEPPDGLAEAALTALARRAPQEIELSGERWYLHPVPPRERLVIVGGSDIAARLIALARDLDFETIHVDPHGALEEPPVPPDRRVRSDAASFVADLSADADTYVVLLTHDPSVDDPVLHRVLPSDVAYVGALGGRRTQEQRRRRLLDQGFDDAAVDRIDGPVGVPIGAVTPAEIAVSIAARLVETRRRRHG